MKKKVVMVMLVSFLAGAVVGKFEVKQPEENLATVQAQEPEEEIPIELEVVEQLAEPQENLLDGFDELEVYDSADLTLEMLIHRDGKLIIERCIGVVEDAEGNGRLLNYPDPEHYYISYASVEENLEPGTVVATYFVYNPDTNYEDDILYRYDYIIDELEENFL